MNPETNRSLLRVLKIFAAIIALPIIALAPAYVASVMLTDRIIDPQGSSEITTTIDVTDIDENGTVMYTVSPSGGYRNDASKGFTVPSDASKDVDLIRITVSDDDHSIFGSEASEECSFTLHLSDDDGFDGETGKFTGYLRVTDEATPPGLEPVSELLQDCGLYVIYSE